jgi:hypothetical protein
MQIAKEVSYWALFRPVDVIDKLVESVLKNKGHVNCVVKILHLVPALAHIQNTDKHIAVFSSVQRRLLTISGRELQNVVNFCRQLVMVLSIYTALFFDNFQLVSFYNSLCLLLQYFVVIAHYWQQSRKLRFRNVRTTFTLVASIQNRVEVILMINIHNNSCTVSKINYFICELSMISMCNFLPETGNFPAYGWHATAVQLSYAQIIAAIYYGSHTFEDRPVSRNRADKTAVENVCCSLTYHCKL